MRQMFIFKTVLVGKNSLSAHPSASCYFQHLWWNTAQNQTGHKRIVSLIQDVCDARECAWSQHFPAKGNKIDCRGTTATSDCICSNGSCARAGVSIKQKHGNCLRVRNTCQDVYTDNILHVLGLINPQTLHGPHHEPLYF